MNDLYSMEERLKEREQGENDEKNLSFHWK